MKERSGGIPAGEGRRAVVVGSGPNGLTAAALLARAGFAVEVFEAAATVGGGTRTSELTVPGLLHDHCSAFHPTALLSPAFAALGADLERHGLRWAWPEIEFAHPLPHGRGAALSRSVEVTAAALGADGPAWQRTFGSLSDHLTELAPDVLGPILRVPQHPVRLGRFGLAGLRPASWLARRWSSDEARGLFGGAAAHVIHPLGRPLTASVGLLLVATGHAVGWPVAIGGSQSIADALAAIVTAAGGRIHTDHPVDDLAALGPAEATVLDLAPQSAADLLGDRLPGRVRRAYRRYRYGPAAFKLDLAVEGGVPWSYEPCRRAGTVHVGGRFEEIAAAERDVHAGRMPAHPFLLVGQQYLADPSRSVGDVHPVWAYCHVPHGFEGDATEAIIGHIERFAPGVRERIVASASRSAPGFAAYNRNFVGGDIATGANDARQLLFRPRLALDPYSTGVPGVVLCSAATPPGAGVHGMGGYHAARRVATEVTRVRRRGR